MRIIDVNDINNLLHDKPDEFIRSCECDYESRCRDIAEKIKEQSAVKPIILLSGPSGAGKTTTALKIEGYLDAMGVETTKKSIDFAVGDTVEIIDGPLMGSVGVVKEIDADNLRVKVEVSMFGRDTLSELDLLRVKPI